MNANDTIFAIALASNLNPETHLAQACQTIETWGEVEFSSQYLIPCRDGIGADYWNSACIFSTDNVHAYLVGLFDEKTKA